MKIQSPNSPSPSTAAKDLRIHPLTPDRWPDLERLFGERGACGGCWCMWWRIKRSEFEERKGEANKQAFRKIVEGGAEPGLLAYDGAEPVGWIAVEPRTSYPVLGRSPILKPVDAEPVWSATCFFIRRDWRRRGLSVRLLEAAAEHVASRGGVILEGYPVEPRTTSYPDAFAWTGPLASFVEAGFEEIARRSPTRPIMRRTLGRSTPRSRRAD